MNHSYLRLKRNESLAVRVKRPDGGEVVLLVPEEHLQRVMDLAEGEFGDKSIQPEAGQQKKP